MAHLKMKLLNWEQWVDETVLNGTKGFGRHHDGPTWGWAHLVLVEIDVDEVSVDWGKGPTRLHVDNIRTDHLALALIGRRGN